MSEMMQHIGVMESDKLRKYGITMLTGEADALGIRTLCDVNNDGLQLLRLTLGVSEIAMGKPMNSRVNGKDSVGSLFIPNDMIPTLCVVALANQPGIVEVWEWANGDLRGMTEKECEEHADALTRYQTRGLDDATWERWYKLHDNWRYNRPMSDEEIREYRKLDGMYKSHWGVVRRIVLAPRNRRGPAGDKQGLTHAKMM